MRSTVELHDRGSQASSCYLENHTTDGMSDFCLDIFLSNDYLFSSARGARRNAFTFVPKVTDNAVRLATKLQCADKFLQSSQ